MSVSDDYLLRVLVCGGRGYSDRARLFSFLDEFKHLGVVASGAAPGADWLAEQWCMEHGVPFKGYPAQWDVHGKAAGPIRNRQMLNEGKPDEALGLISGLVGSEFSKGSQNMADLCGLAGIPCDIERWDGVE